MLALRLAKIALDRSVSALGPNFFRLRLGVTALRLVLALVWLSLFALGPHETALRHSILVPAPWSAAPHVGRRDFADLHP